MKFISLTKCTYFYDIMEKMFGATDVASPTLNRVVRESGDRFQYLFAPRARVEGMLFHYGRTCGRRYRSRNDDTPRRRRTETSVSQSRRRAARVRYSSRPPLRRPPRTSKHVGTPGRPLRPSASYATGRTTLCRRGRDTRSSRLTRCSPPDAPRARRAAATPTPVSSIQRRLLFIRL